RRLAAAAGFVDPELRAVDCGFVQGIARRGGFAGMGHLDEAEASRTAGLTVEDDARGSDGAVRRESRPQFLVRRRVGKVAHVNVHSPELLGSPARGIS